MNCFRISIFAVAKTIIIFRRRNEIMLWIAFELVSLQWQKQFDTLLPVCVPVVNCFRISIFAVAKTIYGWFTNIMHRLWIAFELVSLQWQKQLAITWTMLSSVVNCFRISIFAVAKTIDRWECQSCPLLWIAFELVSLQWQKQYTRYLQALDIRCELLSN